MILNRIARWLPPPEGAPSAGALYWHIGATVTRFESSMGPMESGENSLLISHPDN